MVENQCLTVLGLVCVNHLDTFSLLGILKLLKVGTSGKFILSLKSRKKLFKTYLTLK